MKIDALRRGNMKDLFERVKQMFIKWALPWVAAVIRALPYSDKKPFSRSVDDDGLTSDCIEWWKGFFEYVRTSDFLMGRLDG